MKRILTSLLFLYLITTSFELYAQKKDSLSLSGFAEVYYTKDQFSWDNHARPDFLYNHTASNYIALNSAVLSADYSSERIKANISLVEGTYANRVTSQEKQGFGSLYSAYFIYLPFKNKKHEFKAGIFPSHIGLESAIGLQNICLSRSIAAENTPYYESGISFTLKSKNEKWNASFLVLNGWQNMNKLAQENHPSFGTQFTFQPNKKILFNHSSFIGEVMNFDTLVNRYYQDVYIDYQLNTRWKIQALYDIGLQSHKNNTTNYTWQTAAVMIGYKMNEKLGLGGRLEIFTDPYHNIITYAASDLMGFSMNLNYALRKNLLFRAEYRNLRSQNANFQFETKQSSVINGVNLSLALQF